MDRRAAGALLALAACFACSAAAPTASNQTALDTFDGSPQGCYYNFNHYSEGDRIMTNEPCLNCTCHNRMLMCYLRVCPFTKPIGQDCMVEKRADQCCPIVTCPDVPVDLLASTSTLSPDEYTGTGIAKYDKYGCTINGKHFFEGAKVPPNPLKPCEHCYCFQNVTKCIMQECTLHVEGCTPIYLKDVCCPVRYSCDHPEDEIPLLDDMTTTVRPTPGFLLTTTTVSPVTQLTQDCVHDDQIFSDGALIKTEKACEHCYCMKGDIVCVVQECGTPMENEGKNCTSLPPREGQCCPDTYICEGDELTTEFDEENLTTALPVRRNITEGSDYRKEPDNTSFSESPINIEPEIEGSGDMKPMEEDNQQIPAIIDDTIGTEESLTLGLTTSQGPTEFLGRYTTEPDKGLNTVPLSEYDISESSPKDKITNGYEIPVTQAAITFSDTEAYVTPNLVVSHTGILSPNASDAIEDRFENGEERLTTPQVVSYATQPSKDIYSTLESEYLSPSSSESTLSEITTDVDKFTTKLPYEGYNETELPFISEANKEENLTESAIKLEDRLVTTASDMYTTEKTSTELLESTSILDIDKNKEPLDVTEPEIVGVSDKIATEVTSVDKHDSIHIPSSPSSFEKQDTHTPTTPIPVEALTEQQIVSETVPSESTKSPVTTTVNLNENEIREEPPSILSPGRIPGEGDCLLNSITYSDGSVVPSTNKCESCLCKSSIIKCDPIICSPPPEYMNNCQPLNDSSPDSCCPTYVCDHSKEKEAPKPHSQVSGTDIPLTTSLNDCTEDGCKNKSTEPCVSDDCLGSPEKQTTTSECVNGDCKLIQTHTEKVPVAEESEESCPESECIDSASQCNNETCKPTSDSNKQTQETICDDKGNCKNLTLPDTVQPCVGETCNNNKTGCTDDECGMKTDMSQTVVPVTEQQLHKLENVSSGCSGSECILTSDRQEPDNKEQPKLEDDLSTESFIEVTKDREIEKPKEDNVTIDAAIEISTDIADTSINKEDVTEKETPQISTAFTTTDKNTIAYEEHTPSQTIKLSTDKYPFETPSTVISLPITQDIEKAEATTVDNEEKQEHGLSNALQTESPQRPTETIKEVIQTGTDTPKDQDLTTYPDTENRGDDRVPTPNNSQIQTDRIETTDSDSTQSKDLVSSEYMSSERPNLLSTQSDMITKAVDQDNLISVTKGQEERKPEPETPKLATTTTPAGLSEITTNFAQSPQSTELELDRNEQQTTQTPQFTEDDSDQKVSDFTQQSQSTKIKSDDGESEFTEQPQSTMTEANQQEPQTTQSPKSTEQESDQKVSDFEQSPHFTEQELDRKEEQTTKSPKSTEEGPVQETSDFTITPQSTDSEVYKKVSDFAQSPQVTEIELDHKESEFTQQPQTTKTQSYHEEPQITQSPKSTEQEYDQKVSDLAQSPQSTEPELDRKEEQTTQLPKFTEEGSGQETSDFTQPPQQTEPEVDLKLSEFTQQPQYIDTESDRKEPQTTQTPKPTEEAFGKETLELTQPPQSTEREVDQKASDFTQSPQSTELESDQNVLDFTQEPQSTELQLDRKEPQTTQTPKSTDQESDQKVSDFTLSPQSTEPELDQNVSDFTKPIQSAELDSDKKEAQTTQLPQSTAELEADRKAPQTTESPKFTEQVSDQKVTDFTLSPQSTEPDLDRNVSDFTKPPQSTDLESDKKEAQTTQLPQSTAELEADREELQTTESPKFTEQVSDQKVTDFTLSPQSTEPDLDRNVSDFTKPPQYTELESDKKEAQTTQLPLSTAELEVDRKELQTTESPKSTEQVSDQKIAEFTVSPQSTDLELGQNMSDFTVATQSTELESDRKEAQTTHLPQFTAELEVNQEELQTTQSPKSTGQESDQKVSLFTLSPQSTELELDRKEAQTTQPPQSTESESDQEKLQTTQSPKSTDQESDQKVSDFTQPPQSTGLGSDQKELEFTQQPQSTGIESDRNEPQTTQPPKLTEKESGQEISDFTKLPQSTEQESDKKILEFTQQPHSTEVEADREEPQSTQSPKLRQPEPGQKVSDPTQPPQSTRPESDQKVTELTEQPQSTGIELDQNEPQITQSPKLSEKEPDQEILDSTKPPQSTELESDQKVTQFTEQPQSTGIESDRNKPQTTESPKLTEKEPGQEISDFTKPPQSTEQESDKKILEFTQQPYSTEVESDREESQSTQSPKLTEPAPDQKVSDYTQPPHSINLVSDQKVTELTEQPQSTGIESDRNELQTTQSPIFTENVPGFEISDSTKPPQSTDIESDQKVSEFTQQPQSTGIESDRKEQQTTEIPKLTEKEPDQEISDLTQPPQSTQQEDDKKVPDFTPPPQSGDLESEQNVSEFTQQPQLTGIESDRNEPQTTQSPKLTEKEPDHEILESSQPPQSTQQEVDQKVSDFTQSPHSTELEADQKLTESTQQPQSTDMESDKKEAQTTQPPQFTGLELDQDEQHVTQSPTYTEPESDRIEPQTTQSPKSTELESDQNAPSFTKPPQSTELESDLQETQTIQPPQSIDLGLDRKEPQTTPSPISTEPEPDQKVSDFTLSPQPIDQESGHKVPQTTLPDKEPELNKNDDAHDSTESSDLSETPEIDNEVDIKNIASTMSSKTEKPFDSTSTPENLDRQEFSTSESIGEGTTIGTLVDFTALNINQDQDLRKEVISTTLKPEIVTSVPKIQYQTTISVVDKSEITTLHPSSHVKEISTQLPDLSNDHTTAKQSDDRSDQKTENEFTNSPNLNVQIVKLDNESTEPSVLETTQSDLLSNVSPNANTSDQDETNTVLDRDGVTENNLLSSDSKSKLEKDTKPSAVEYPLTTQISDISQDKETNLKDFSTTLSSQKATEFTPINSEGENPVLSETQSGVIDQQSIDKVTESSQTLHVDDQATIPVGVEVTSQPIDDLTDSPRTPALEIEKEVTAEPTQDNREDVTETPKYTPMQPLEIFTTSKPGLEAVAEEFTPDNKYENVNTDTSDLPVTEEVDTNLTDLERVEDFKTTPYLVELQEHTHKPLPSEAPTTYETGTETESQINIEHSEHEPMIPIKEEMTETDQIISSTVEPNFTEQQKTTEDKILSEITTQAAESADHKLADKFGSDENVQTVTTFTSQQDSSTVSPKDDITVQSNILSESSANKAPSSSESTLVDDELISATVKTTMRAEATTESHENRIEEVTSTTTPPKTSYNEVHSTDDLPQTDDETHPSGSPIYGQEPDYVEEDQAFGPGTCRYGGKVYVSAQQIPRDDPCDFCFCFRSDIICLQQSCPPPIQGCHEEPIQGFCCPRYECPVSMATTLNVTTTTTTTTTTLPPHFPTHAYNGAAQRQGCHINKQTYKVGEVVKSASGPCLHCTCGGDGQMKCDPKVCTPEPMLRQMIAAAVSAKRRR